MVDLYKQLKPRRCATIVHYVPPALLRVVDSVRHNLAFYRVTPREFLVNWVTMAAPIIRRVSLARENEAGGSWGQEVHILHVNI